MDNGKTIRSFPTSIRGLLAAVAFVTGMVMTSSAFALNALQLGPDGSSDWTYVGGGDDTWYYNGTQPFTLNAYANATGADGGNGAYAWDTEPDSDQYAYLVAAAVPDLGDIGDIFTMMIENDSFNLTMVDSGYGTPPVEDTNSLSSHGIYDTYFEVYEFKFDGSIGDISDTQPGQTGTGKGYTEAFDISWTDLTGGSITGIHFDLFTVASEFKNPDGPGYIGGPDNKFVQANAPYSHDAQSTPPGGTPPSGIPEPSLVALFSMGLLGMGLAHHRRKRKAS